MNGTPSSFGPLEGQRISDERLLEIQETQMDPDTAIVQMDATLLPKADTINYEGGIIPREQFLRGLPDNPQAVRISFVMPPAKSDPQTGEKIPQKTKIFLQTGKVT